MKTITDCEKEIIRLAKNGKTIKETALLLSKSENTIKTQRYILMQRMGVNSMLQVITILESKNH